MVQKTGKVGGKNMEKQFLTVKDIAAAQQVTEMTVRNWIKAKKLKAIKIGKSYKIQKEEYDLLCKRGI